MRNKPLSEIDECVPILTEDRAAMNEHEAETVQFLALINSKRPVLAMTLAFFRTKFAIRALSLGGAIILILLGVPQQAVRALL